MSNYFETPEIILQQSTVPLLYHDNMIDEICDQTYTQKISIKSMMTVMNKWYIIQEENYSYMKKEKCTKRLQYTSYLRWLLLPDVNCDFVHEDWLRSQSWCYNVLNLFLHFYEENPAVTGGSSPKRDSNVESVSIPWCHHIFHVLMALSVSRMHISMSR